MPWPPSYLLMEYIVSPLLRFFFPWLWLWLWLWLRKPQTWKNREWIEATGLIRMCLLYMYMYVLVHTSAIYVGKHMPFIHFRIFLILFFFLLFFSPTKKKERERERERQLSNSQHASKRASDEMIWLIWICIHSFMYLLIYSVTHSLTDKEGKGEGRKAGRQLKRQAEGRREGMNVSQSRATRSEYSFLSFSFSFHFFFFSQKFLLIIRSYEKILLLNEHPCS